jgi:hypothetical protein
VRIVAAAKPMAASLLVPRSPPSRRRPARRRDPPSPWSRFPARSTSRPAKRWHHSYRTSSRGGLPLKPGRRPAVRGASAGYPLRRKQTPALTGHVLAWGDDRAWSPLFRDARPARSAWACPRPGAPPRSAGSWPQTRGSGPSGSAPAARCGWRPGRPAADAAPPRTSGDGVGGSVRRELDLAGWLDAEPRLSAQRSRSPELPRSSTDHCAIPGPYHASKAWPDVGGGREPARAFPVGNPLT